MAWTIRIDPRAERELARLDRQVQRRIVRFLRDRVGSLENPRQLGKPLSGPERTLWRYRVGDWRIVADLRDRELIVLVVRLGHRSTIYRR